MTKKNNASATPLLETFDVASLAQLWTQTSVRFIDELEKAGKSSLVGLERLGEESRKLGQASLETSGRVFDASIEAARNVTAAFTQK